MKKLLIILIAVFFASLTANGQNLFIIGEKSYPCTKEIRLESNSDDRDEDDTYDLNIFVGKNGSTGVIAVSTKSIYGSEFIGKLNIYLEDGSVLICNESEDSEQVDDRAIAVYYLTNEQLNKLKFSNIHTVKYMMKLFGEQKYSASNKGIETHEIISDFFSPLESPSKVDKMPDDPIEPLISQDIDDEEPYAYVEQMPTFPEGTEAMYKYIYEKIEYPAIAKANGISGQVIVQFVVSESGVIQNAKIVRGIGGGCNEEALRVVNSMPPWKPGKHNGQNVPVTFTLPIKFVPQY